MFEFFLKAIFLLINDNGKQYEQYIISTFWDLVQVVLTPPSKKL